MLLKPTKKEEWRISEEKNEAAEIRQRQVAIAIAAKDNEIEKLKAERDALKDIASKATKALDDINRAQLAKRLLAETSLPEETISQMSTDAMEQHVSFLDIVKKPIAGARMLSGGNEAADPRITVGGGFDSADWPKVGMRRS